MSLLDDKYLAERARLIGPQSMKTATPGNPGHRAHQPRAHARSARIRHQPHQHRGRHGNAVAMTTTIEDVFGARQMVKGFLLNNELTDFSFAPADAQGKPIANRVQAGKRPRSSMAPTLVFDKATGKLVMSGGSPGGALIIHFTAKTLYGVLNWGMTPQQAINLPNFASLNGPSILEEKRFPARHGGSAARAGRRGARASHDQRPAGHHQRQRARHPPCGWAAPTHGAKAS
jgi:gamma-glutamyltranspeptidase/glutathione hydrolase